VVGNLFFRLAFPRPTAPPCETSRLIVVDGLGLQSENDGQAHILQRAIRSEYTIIFMVIYQIVNLRIHIDPRHNPPASARMN
jgi:hypothetical protein